MSDFLWKLASGVFWAFKINFYNFYERVLKDKKVIVCVFNSESQFMHLESVVKRLQCIEGENLAFVFLVNPPSISVLDDYVKKHGISGFVGSLFSSKFLIFWSLVLTVTQSAHLPKLGKGKKICTFHGQPSKGNVYNSDFKYNDINALFFYGPMMKECYFEEKKKHPYWKDIDTYEIGQPKTDCMFFEKEKEVKSGTFIKNNDPVVLYAPSFEYCGSLFQDGEVIIQALVQMDINVIIKPHPAIYNASPENVYWRKKLKEYSKNNNCVFFDFPDGGELIHMIDIMVTDYSGIAFDAFLLDKPVVFWECPLFYNEYLPNIYKIDGKVAKAKLYANVGRDGGIVVDDVCALKKAIEMFVGDRCLMLEKRDLIKKQILYNRGNATNVAVDTIMDILKVGERNK